MKIAVVWSSPNLDGLTASSKNKFITGLKRTGAEIEEIHLNSQYIEHCKACGNGLGLCYTQGRCVIKDDFEAIYQKLKIADGIVFVSAVYWFDLTEYMKAFLDRLRRCDAMHNGALKGKSCFLIACAGGTGNGAIECLSNLERTTRHMGMSACDRVPVLRFNMDYMLPALEKAGEVFGSRLATSGCRKNSLIERYYYYIEFYLSGITFIYNSI